MKAVGIKQLKARLSEYVRLAKSGETVLVMERDEVVAELRAARKSWAPSSLEETLDALAQAGEIERASVPKKGWVWKPVNLGLKPGTSAKILDALRADEE